MSGKKAPLSNHLRTHGLVESPYADLNPIKRRRRPTNGTKLLVLKKLQEYYETYGRHAVRRPFDEHIGWASSSISLWLKSPGLRRVAELPWCTALKRLRSVVLSADSKFRAEQDILYKRFLFRRQAEGLEVDQQWIRDEMRAIMYENKPLGYRDFRYSPGWMSRFLDHYEVTHQLQTEKKNMCNALRVPLLQTFHRDLCEIQNTPNGLNEWDPMFGAFPAKGRWNIDQVPFYFVKSHRGSYNPKGTECWIMTQGESGNEKRMATIIMTLRAEGEQVVPPFILFRGQGEIAKDLLAELDAQGIPYAFNEKGYANEESCIEHLKFFSKIVQKECPDVKEHMLLLDGFGAQSTKRYIDFALDLNILPVYFPPNCTHLVQPVDHRIAAWLKRAIHELYKVEESVMHQVWADFRENDSLNPQFQRKTMLKWIRSCWTELLTKPDFILRSFVSTGCLITLKGDNAITFKGIADYKFST